MQVVYEKGGSVLRMLHAYLTLAPTTSAPLAAEAPDAAGDLPAWQLRRLSSTAASASVEEHATKAQNAVGFLRSLRRALRQAPPSESSSTADSSDPFFKAINTYLQANLYGTGGTDELLQIISESAGRPERTEMQRWTHQQGVPVLTLSKDGDIMMLSQAQLTQTGSVPVKCGVPLDTVMELPQAGGPSTLGSGTPGELQVDLNLNGAADVPAPAPAEAADEAAGETQSGPAAAPGGASGSGGSSEDELRLAWWVPVRVLSSGADAAVPGDVQWLEVRQSQQQNATLLLC